MSGARDLRRPYFFMHIMKTAGTTFVSQIQENFGLEYVYPSALDVPEEGFAQPYARIESLVHLSAERRSRTQVYAGHFPFVAYELLGLDAVTMTILRDPVDRTVSMLKHCKREIARYAEMNLEEIYEDRFVRAAFVDNFQTKQFAYTPADNPPSCLAVLAIDDDRFRHAKANLDRVDVVGITENYAVFLDQMRNRFGWTFSQTKSRNVSREAWDVSVDLRRRIGEDNRFDREFYEHARQRAGV